MLLKEISCMTDLSRRIARRVELLFLAFIAVSPEATAQDAQCVPERAVMSLARASGAARASHSKFTNCLLRFTGVSLRASTRAIRERPGFYSTKDKQVHGRSLDFAGISPN